MLGIQTILQAPPVAQHDPPAQHVAAESGHRSFSDYLRQLEQDRNRSETDRSYRVGDTAAHADAPHERASEPPGNLAAGADRAGPQPGAAAADATRLDSAEGAATPAEGAAEVAATEATATGTRTGADADGKTPADTEPADEGAGAAGRADTRDTSRRAADADPALGETGAATLAAEPATAAAGIAAPDAGRTASAGSTSDERSEAGRATKDTLKRRAPAAGGHDDAEGPRKSAAGRIGAAADDSPGLRAADDGQDATALRDPRDHGAHRDTGTKPAERGGPERPGTGGTAAGPTQEGTTIAAARAATTGNAQGETRPAGESRGEIALRSRRDARRGAAATTERKPAAEAAPAAATQPTHAPPEGEIREIELSLDGGEHGEAERSEEITRAVRELAARSETPGAARSEQSLSTANARSLTRQLNGELGSQIVRQARLVLQSQGRGEIHLVIRPPELGRIRIRVSMENGHIAGTIRVDNGSVREVVEQNLAALERAFEEAGLEVEGFEVSTGDARDGSGERRFEAPTPPERVLAQLEGGVKPAAAYGWDHHRINLVA